MSSPTKHADGSAPTQGKKKNIYDSNRKKKQNKYIFTVKSVNLPKNTFHILMAYNFTFRSHNHTKRRFILDNRLEKR